MKSAGVFTVAAAVCATQCAGFLVPQPMSALTSCRRSRSSARTVMSMAPPADKTGLHGTQSRFMPIVQIDEDEHMPQNIAIAGEYPGITAEELKATPFSTEAPEEGSWQYDFTDAEGPQLGTVALPGSDLLAAMADPVIVVANSMQLNIELAENDQTEVLLVVDRGDTREDLGKFFVWQNPEGEVVVRYFLEQPGAGWTILGRVGQVMMPWLASMGKQTSGFAEESESY